MVVKARHSSALAASVFTIAQETLKEKAWSLHATSSSHRGDTFHRWPVASPAEGGHATVVELFPHGHDDESSRTVVGA